MISLSNPLPFFGGGSDGSLDSVAQARAAAAKENQLGAEGQLKPKGKGGWPKGKPRGKKAAVPQPQVGRAGFPQPLGPVGPGVPNQLLDLDPMFECMGKMPYEYMAITRGNHWLLTPQEATTQKALISITTYQYHEQIMKYSWVGLVVMNVVMFGSRFLEDARRVRAQQKKDADRGDIVPTRPGPASSPDRPNRPGKNGGPKTPPGSTVRRPNYNR